MLRTTLASAAFVALAQATGSAIVVNSCSYTAYLANTPASGGGYSEIDKSLAPGETYSQEFTELSNGNGWSLKLSKVEGAYSSNILQYEYTYHNDGTIWYDLSEVNGNPWDGNWEITSAGDCSPRQAAYRYATDDAYGMQDCPANSDITVLLCSGESQADGLASAVASGSAPSSTALASAPETSAAAAPAAASPTFLNEGNFHNAQVQETQAPASTSEVVATPTATTLITQAAAPQGVVVTEYATVVVTEIATATHYARDQHAHRHVHRHPHAR